MSLPILHFGNIFTGGIIFTFYETRVSINKLKINKQNLFAIIV